MPETKERAVALLDDLAALLADEDLTDEKLRKASETLLPRLHDAGRKVMKARAWHVAAALRVRLRALRYQSSITMTERGLMPHHIDALAEELVPWITALSSGASAHWQEGDPIPHGISDPAATPERNPAKTPAETPHLETPGLNLEGPDPAVVTPEVDELVRKLILDVVDAALLIAATPEGEETLDQLAAARRKEIAEFVAGYALEIDPPPPLVQLRKLVAAAAVEDGEYKNIAINANSAPTPEMERIPKGLHWLAGEMHEIARRAKGSGYSERAKAYLEASDMVSDYANRLAARLQEVSGGS